MPRRLPLECAPLASGWRATVCLALYTQQHGPVQCLRCRLLRPLPHGGGLLRYERIKTNFSLFFLRHHILRTNSVFERKIGHIRLAVPYR